MLHLIERWVSGRGGDAALAARPFRGTRTPRLNRGVAERAPSEVNCWTDGQEWGGDWGSAEQGPGLVKMPRILD